MTYETTVVVMSQRQLVLFAARGGGPLRYHGTRWRGRVFVTRCGHKVWDGSDDMALREQWTRIRRDTADLIADPCMVCFP